jgi:hypothetical protein
MRKIVPHTDSNRGPPDYKRPLEVIPLYPNSSRFSPMVLYSFAYLRAILPVEVPLYPGISLTLGAYVVPKTGGRK